MAEAPQEPQPGLVLRIVSGMIGYSIVFGALWPPSMWILGDSKGFKADLRDGLLQGALVGLLMALFGESLAGWIDRIFRRKKTNGSGP